MDLTQWSLETRDELDRACDGLPARKQTALYLSYVRFIELFPDEIASHVFSTLSGMDIARAKARIDEAFRKRTRKGKSAPLDRVVSFDYRVIDGKLVRREYWLIAGQMILKDIECANKVRVVIDGVSQEVTLILKNL